MKTGYLNENMNANIHNTEDTIYFNFSYAALKMLGKNLYSNAANAISELVANALDAKADKVYIYIDMSDKANSVIEILDNGTGMSYSDLAEKYVWVGRNKRMDKDLKETDKISVMGRKGIGKLAALFLSNQYYIITKKADEQDKNQWKVDLSKYEDFDFPRLDRITEKVQIINEDVWNGFEHGTLIKLKNVDLRGNGEKKIAALKKVFADFYLVDELESKIYIAVKTQETDDNEFELVDKSIAFKNFYAVFDNSGLDVAARMADSIKFTWASHYEHIANEDRETKRLDENEFLTKGVYKFKTDEGTLVEKSYEMKGWIAIHSTIEQKNSSDSNFIRNAIYQPNRLRVYVRNKLAVSDYYTIKPNTQTMANYIEGEISFDILDDDDLPDIATSSRQDFLQDARVEMLIKIVEPILGQLFKLRNDIGRQITEETKRYSEYLKEEERRKRQVEEDARLKAEKEAFKAEQAKLLAEKRQKLAEDEVAREKKRNEYLINVSGVEDKNLMNSVHSIYNMSHRVKENLDSLNSLNELSARAYKKLEKASVSNQRILSMSKLISKAGRVIDDNDAKKEVVLSSFVAEYVKNVLSIIYDSEDILIECTGDLEAEYKLKIKPLSFIMMLDNLVGNSIKADARNIKIIVDDSNEEYYHLILSDDGKGISDAITDINTVFDFGVTTTNGSGLGLYYAQKQMKELKGIISIKENNDTGVSVILSWKK